MTIDEIRELIAVTIPKGESKHIKRRLLEDRNALSIIAVAMSLDGTKITPVSIQDMKEAAVQVLLLNSIKVMIIEGVIDFSVILALSEPPSRDFLEFFALEYYGSDIREIKKKGEYKVLQRLVSKSGVNDEQLFYLKTCVYILLMNEHIQKLVRDGEISLSKLQKLSSIADRLLEIKEIKGLIANKYISMGDLLYFIEHHGNKADILVNSEVISLIKAGVDIKSLSLIDVHLLQINHKELSEGMKLDILGGVATRLTEAVAEESASYLHNLRAPKTLWGFHCFMQLILKIEKTGLEAVWDEIEGRIANRLFPIFIWWCLHEPVYEKYRQALPKIEDGALFTTYEHQVSTNSALMSGGSELASENRQKEACTIFRRQVQAGCSYPVSGRELRKKVLGSSGYQQYLSGIMHQSRLFNTTSNDHRHKALEDQPKSGGSTDQAPSK